MRKIIGIDVSKSTAKLSVAIDAKTVYEGDITLDMIGFTSLKAIIDSYGGAEVVFEATGVYSPPLIIIISFHRCSKCRCSSILCLADSH